MAESVVGSSKIERVKRGKSDGKRIVVVVESAVGNGKIVQVPKIKDNLQMAQETGHRSQVDRNK